jgi:hypothetical protein
MATVTTKRESDSEVERLRYEKQLRQREIATAYQQRADSVFQNWGTRARQRTEGEDIEAYRRSLAIQAKRMLPVSDAKPSSDYTATFNDLRGLQLRRMPSDVFERFEGQVFDACAKAAERNDTVPAGQMRMVRRIDPETGVTMNLFYGQRSFIEDFKAPAFRARIRNPDTDPGWFTDSARRAPAPIGYDQSAWHRAFQRHQISQGHVPR